MARSGRRVEFESVLMQEYASLSKADARAAPRKHHAAAELVSTVREARSTGTFKVALSQAGLSYSVE
eukprot:12914205-Alexandrium_andersonii.AAC.1